LQSSHLVTSSVLIIFTRGTNKKFHLRNLVFLKEPPSLCLKIQFFIQEDTRIS
jgi:hypothetical protein